MGKKLYVGNLSYDVNSSDLENLLAPHGTIQSADIIVDRDSGRSKGFGFVEMESDAEAGAAIAALSGLDLHGRRLVVEDVLPSEVLRESPAFSVYVDAGDCSEEQLQALYDALSDLHRAAGGAGLTFSELGEEVYVQSGVIV